MLLSVIRLKHKAVVTKLEHSVPAGEVILRPPPTPDRYRSDCVCMCVFVSNRQREEESLGDVEHSKR